jgi:hypothetical protein
MIKKKTNNTDEVIIACSECGHKHKYESIEEFDSLPIGIPCDGCGFLFLQYIVNKMKALKALLEADDPKAIAMLKSGNVDELHKYLDEVFKL